MSKKDGNPCSRCGGDEWESDGSCLPCKRAYYKKWVKDNREKRSLLDQRYRENNGERIKARKRKSYAQNPDRQKQKSKEWGKNNREANASRSKKWYEQNIERAKKSKKLWKKNNPQKDAASKNRRRALKQESYGSYTDKQFIRLCDKYKNTCLCCGSCDVKLTADHIVPLSKGGANTIDNIQPLCGSCNSRKGTKTIDYRPDKEGFVRWIQKKLF